ncbi:glioma pathogenesis-related protein 1-like isoform X1 [Styela clava]
MLKFFFIILLSCLFWKDSVGETALYLLPLTNEDIENAVDIHNEKRKIPNASNMKLMEWDSTLQQQAEEFVDRCEFKHDADLNGAGENLAVGGLIADAFKLWYDEVELYNYTDGSCDGVCTHYTQLVWANTYKVGCAVAMCNSVKYTNFASGYLVSCRYFPPGNHYLYGVPVSPYLSGDECTACSSEWMRCEDGLCSRNFTDTTMVTPTVTQEKTSTISVTQEDTPTAATTEEANASEETSVTTGFTASRTTTVTAIPEATSSEISTTSPTNQTTGVSTEDSSTAATTPGTTASPLPDNCITDEAYVEAFREYQENMSLWKAAFGDYLSAIEDTANKCGCS